MPDFDFSFPMDDVKKDTEHKVEKEELQSIDQTYEKTGGENTIVPRSSDYDMQVNQLRDFPAVLVRMAEIAIPQARNKTDAVAAYLLALLTNTDDIPLPPRLFELAKGYVGSDLSDSVTILKDEIRLLRNDLRKMQDIAYQSNLMLEYMLAERTGMLKKYVTSGDVKTIDYFDDSIERLREHTEQSSSTIVNELRYRENLAKRDSIYKKRKGFSSR